MNCIHHCGAWYVPKHHKRMLNPPEWWYFDSLSLEVVIEKLPYRGIGDFHASAWVYATGAQQGCKQGRNEGEVGEVQMS